MEEFFRQIKGHNSKTEKIELGLPFMFSYLVYKFQTICEELKSVSGNQMHTDMGKSMPPTPSIGGIKLHQIHTNKYTYVVYLWLFH